MTKRYSTTEREGVNKVESIFLNKFKWIFREQTTSDFGIDAQVEYVSEDGPTGKLIGLQIKTGLSNFHEKESSFIFYLKEVHYKYWINHSLPVLLIGYIPKYEIIIWSFIKDDTVSKTKKGYKVEILKNNLLDSDKSVTLITSGVKSNIQYSKKNKLLFTHKINLETVLEPEVTKVIVKNKDLYSIDINGKEKQLTFNKSDENPIFLKGSRKVIYTRSIEEKNQYRNYKRYKLMSINIDDLIENTITDKKPYYDGLDRTNEILNIINPSISLDHKFIYFITEKYATGNELVKVDISNGKWAELFPTENYTLIKKGIYKSLFLINRSEIGYKGRDIYYKLCDEKGEIKKEFNNESSFNIFKLSIV